jgi:uncharacterized DUF497 family protein
VAFADATVVFDDPRAVTIDDPHPNEERYVTIGLDALGRVVVVLLDTTQRRRSVDLRSTGEQDRAIGI